MPDIYPKPGTINENAPAYITSRHMPVSSRFSPYIQDGKGRDSYIYAAHHGASKLSPQTRRAKETFYNQLRQYEGHVDAFMNAPSVKVNETYYGEFDKFGNFHKPDYFQES